MEDSTTPWHSLTSEEAISKTGSRISGLTNKEVTEIVDTPEEYLNMIRTMRKLDRDSIIKSNEAIIASGYSRNIKLFVDDLGAEPCPCILRT